MDNHRKNQIREIARLRIRIDRDEGTSVLKHLLHRELAEIKRSGGLSNVERDYLDYELTKQRKERDDAEIEFDDQYDSPEEESEPEELKTNNHKKAVDFRNSPLTKIWQHIHNSDVDWKSNNHNHIKAYVLSCFSELAYLHVSDSEAENLGRFRIIFPSELLREVIRRRIKIQFSDIIQLADLNPQIIERQNYIYFVIRFRDITIVSVRGTKFLGDWLTNFDARKITVGNGFYHAGFYNEANEAIAELSKITRDSKHVYFTGHSLGAAVASILAQRWPSENEIKSHYVFACPRVACARNSGLLKRFSYLKPKDIVPHVPSSILGFSHKGSEILILPPDKKQSSGLNSLVNIFTGITLRHHKMEKIRMELGELVNESYPERVYVDQIIDRFR